jgi:RNA polymerase sigma-70 factor, ECF subfamily
MIWSEGQSIEAKGEIPDENQIMRDAQADPAEFAPLYEHYYPRIYKYCWRRVGRMAEAEDLTSQVFIRALAGIQNYRGGSVAAWLFQIAHNVTSSYFSRQKPQVSLDRLSETVNELPENDQSTIDQLLQAEEQLYLVQLINNLPEEQRNLLLLKVVGKLTAKEIGVIVGKSDGAVRIAIYRIIEQLRSGFAQIEKEQ